MPNRIKQISRKDEVTRMNEYSSIYRGDRGREITPGHTTRETSAFLSHALWSSQLLERRW